MEVNEAQEAYTQELEERLAALEMALETDGWRTLAGGSEQEFSRQGLRTIAELARLNYLKNPIVQRAVDVKRYYVWGQGWTVKAGDADVQAAIDAFLNDTKNDDALTGHEARMQMEIELQCDGNLFLCLFVNQLTGRVRVRNLPFAEVDDILYNPDDAKEPWYYRRVWVETRTDMQSGLAVSERRSAYYPDWRFSPVARPATIGGAPVQWDTPVYHVKVGGFSNWRFGVPEIYDLLDWARAYKDFLEDWASIVRAYRRFAFQLSTPGSKSAVAAAKARLSTGIASEGNPAPIAGSTFVAGEGYNLQPVRTSGATVSAEDGRRLLLMVAAGSGLPETFFGDASIGTLATAKSLDRPTELLMMDRQQLWRDVFANLFEYVLRWAVKAPQGALRSLGRVSRYVEDEQYEEHLTWNADIEGEVTIEFPSLLQHDVSAQVAAIVQAATLGQAGTPAGTIDMPTLSRMLLVSLGAPDAEQIVAALFPDGDVPADAPRPQAEAILASAIQELHRAITEAAAGA